MQSSKTIPASVASEGDLAWLINLTNPSFPYCQTLGLVLRLRVDFVLPLSQEEQEEQEQEQQEQPLTKIYQKGVY